MKARIDELERIIVAMCRGERFAITIDLQGRPRMIANAKPLFTTQGMTFAVGPLWTERAK